MSQRPVLPERRNPMLEEERAPQHEILVERRCLGQTELKVKPGQVGTSNATKIENLGVLDYAHLRVPLPKDLSGSGIFTRAPKGKWPEAYFLMRRSADGFVSATGMFKAAFPFAQQDEETAEKEYIKSLEEASSEEVAGNVWIDPGKALDLADEYGITLWIAALLDSEPIMHGASDPKKSIRSPPPYHLKETNGVGRTPEKEPELKRSTRGTRSLRSVSPSGASVTGRSQASPRKKAIPRKSTREGRKTRGGTLSSVDEDYKPEGINGETVTVEVESTVVPDAEGEELVETTKATIALPAGLRDLPMESPDEMLEKARQMVEDAKKIQGASSARKGKRKAEELLEEEEIEEGPARPAKKQRPLELELRKQRIQRRTWTGIAATLAIGALIPSVLNLL